MNDYETCVRFYSLTLNSLDSNLLSYNLKIYLSYYFPNKNQENISKIVYLTTKVEIKIFKCLNSQTNNKLGEVYRKYAQFIFLKCHDTEI